MYLLQFLIRAHSYDTESFCWIGHFVESYSATAIHFIYSCSHDTVAIWRK